MSNTVLSPDRLVMFRYMNHRGETSVRQIYIEDLSFIAQPGYNYQPGWFLPSMKAKRTEIGQSVPILSGPYSDFLEG